MGTVTSTAFVVGAGMTPFTRGHIDRADIEGRAVALVTYEPGFRWSVDLQPVMGTELCEAHHQGYVLGGVLRLEMADGSTHEIGPGEVYDIPPGHDGSVVGDEPWVAIDWEFMRPR